MSELKSRSLYEGEVEIIFNDKNHEYRVNGERWITSVTAVTGQLDKPALKYWACNMMEQALLEFIEANQVFSLTTLKAQIEEAKKAHTQKKEEAATSGTMVHAWAEQYILNQIEGKPKPEIPEDEKVMNGAMAFLKWVDENEIKFIASELLVYSKKHHYAGLMDCKFTIGGEGQKIVHCGDFKTSSGIYNEMLYQVSAYQEADTEESGEEYGSTYIIRFDKDTAEFEVKEISPEDNSKNFQAFLGLLQVKRREKELNKLK